MTPRLASGHTECVALADVVDRIVREADAAVLDRATRAFQATTGAFAAGDPWYEERIAATFDHAVASFEGGALARRFAERTDVSDLERCTALALPRAERSLFRVVSDESAGPVLECLLGGALYGVEIDTPSARLRPGDLFDGRIVAVEERLLLMPGPVFHPREAHEAIDALLARVRAASRSDADLPDAMLRMRLRFDRFTSIHARHVYRFEAIDTVEILAAPWARSG